MMLIYLACVLRAIKELMFLILLSFGTRVENFTQHAVKVILVLLRPFARPLWARYFCNSLERILPFLQYAAYRPPVDN